MDADCAEGYTGPLCAVCNDGHYKLVATCFKCPALHWLIFQVSTNTSGTFVFYFYYDP